MTMHIAERLEIFVEESSMEVFLENYLPRVLPDGWELGINVFIRPHEGKQDLERSVRQKVPVLHNFGIPVRLLVIHDQDSNNCITLKQKLVDLVKINRVVKFPYLVRIACRELENWYLGDIASLAKAYPKLNASNLARRSIYRVPDNLQGARELEKLVGYSAKTDAARKLGTLLDSSTNSSRSFQEFTKGLKHLLG